MQFGRKVITDALKIPEKFDWKACKVSTKANKEPTVFSSFGGEGFEINANFRKIHTSRLIPRSLIFFLILFFTGRSPPRRCLVEKKGNYLAHLTNCVI